MDYCLVRCKGSPCAKQTDTGNKPEEVIYLHIFLAGLLTTELQTLQRIVFMPLKCLQQTVLVKRNST